MSDGHKEVLQQSRQHSKCYISRWARLNAHATIVKARKKIAYIKDQDVDPAGSQTTRVNKWHLNLYTGHAHAPLNTTQTKLSAYNVTKDPARKHGSRGSGGAQHTGI